VSGADRPNDGEPSSKHRSPAHGFFDDDATRRLLRTRPPRQSLQWAERHLGGTVISTKALRGGMSSAVHLLTVLGEGDQRWQAVLRRYVRPEVNAEEPDIAAREARTLQLVEPISVPTPHLLAVDTTGAEAGVPALLMTRVPGRVDWWPKDMERWLQPMAEVLPSIHAATVTPPRAIRPYATYAQTSSEPPAWARHPTAWEQAVEIAAAPPPDLPEVLVQRDFHPGNVLWRQGAVSGVVDWQAASIGPAVADVGHCRANLLTFDRHIAERFTALWEQVSGMTYHPWADVVTIIDFLDDLRSDWGSERDLIEDLLVDAVAELTGGA
jgi:aminoglycoside phosphotransferase (APT) family kinase protein